MGTDASHIGGMRHTARLTLALMRAPGLPSVRWLMFLALVGAACEVMAVAALLPLMVGLNSLDGEAHLMQHSGVLSGVLVPHTLATAIVLVSVMVLAILSGLLIRRHLIQSAYAHAGALAARLFNHVLHQDPWRVAEKGAAPLNDAVINDSERVCSHVFLGLLVVLGNVCSGLGIALVLACAQPWLALGLSLAIGIIYLGWLSRVRRNAIHLGHEVQALTQQVLNTGQASFQGIAAVQSLGAQDGLARQQAAVLVRRAQRTGQAEWLGEMPRKVVELVALAATLAILLWTMVAKVAVREVLPLMALYLFAAFRMLPVVQQTFQQVIRLRFNATTVQRLTDMLADAPAVSVDGTLAPQQDEVRLAMQGVWFSHAQPGVVGQTDVPVLRDASLVARQGQFIAIVGASGAGKSSALWLLAGLARPDRGEVLRGRSLMRTEQPLRCVLVPQDVAVWEATLLANVALGELNPDLGRAQEAARVAALEEVVARLPEGWHTLLTGDLGRLSGGERQRLALARAIYVNPDVLLLDEVTSALDADTERNVLFRIRAWQGARTVIMVTHRQAVVQQADSVQVLEAGCFRPLTDDAPDAMEVLT